jgi:hypothetical protein
MLGAWVLGSADQVVFESESVARVFHRTGAISLGAAADRERRRYGRVPARAPPPSGCSAAPSSASRRQAGAAVHRQIRREEGSGVLRELTGRIGEAHWLFAGWGPMDPATGSGRTSAWCAVPRPPS